MAHLWELEAQRAVNAHFERTYPPFPPSALAFMRGGNVNPTFSEAKVEHQCWPPIIRLQALSVGLCPQDQTKVVSTSSSKTLGCVKGRLSETKVQHFLPTASLHSQPCPVNKVGLRWWIAGHAVQPDDRTRCWPR
eukprot:3891693-Amphidinium_carterae.1